MPEGRGLLGLSEKGEEIKKYVLVLTNSLGDGRYSVGNTVSNTVMITMCGASRVLEISGRSL